LLIAIQKRLNIGNVNIRGNKAIFIIGAKDALLVLFNILEKYPLNTSKYLNYPLQGSPRDPRSPLRSVPRGLAFKQAYEIYHKCKLDSQKDPDSLNLLLQTKKELLAIKSTMNSKRVDYTMPKAHSINITPY
jgi:hypothetical protein